MHKLVLDGISENMYSLVQLVKYGSINSEGPTTIGCYVIKYLCEPYTLQEYQITYAQVIKEGEILAKA